MCFEEGYLYCGGVAHLGERLNGIQEVRGSSPLISITNGCAIYVAKDFRTKDLIAVRKRMASTLSLGFI